jgi:hypothetical protein
MSPTATIPHSLAELPGYHKNHTVRRLNVEPSAVRENTGHKSLHDKSFWIEDKTDTILVFVQCRRVLFFHLGLIRAGQEDGWRTVF